MESCYHVRNINQTLYVMNRKSRHIQALIPSSLYEEVYLYAIKRNLLIKDLVRKALLHYLESFPIQDHFIKEKKHE